MSDVLGRTATSYADFYGEDDQPRIWETTEVDADVRHYHVQLPCGHRGVLSEDHHVERHDDGAFSVVPQPGNSNSIQCTQCPWHGYIRNNLFYDA